MFEYNKCRTCKYYNKINIVFGNCQKFQIQTKFDSKCPNYELELVANEKK